MIRLLLSGIKVVTILKKVVYNVTVNEMLGTFSSHSTLSSFQCNSKCFYCQLLYFHLLNVFVLIIFDTVSHQYC